MALVIKDRVKDTTTTTGTGSVTVSGTAPTGFRTFDDALASADTSVITIHHQTADEWEICETTYSGSNVLTRGTLLASSTGSRVSFSAGTKDVWIDFAAAKVVDVDRPQTLTNKTVGAVSFANEVTGAPGTAAMSAVGSSSKISININAKGNYVPVTVGASLYPAPYNDFQRYDINSIFVANSIGARNINIGYASAIGASANSWCNSLEPGTDVALQNSIYSISPVGRGAGVFASRSSDLPSAGEAMCTQFIVLSDNASGACAMQGVMISGYVDAGVHSGFHHTNSFIYVANSYATSVTADPFSVTPDDSVYCLQLGSGNGGFVASPTNATAALALLDNTGKFNSGIIIGDGALDTATSANPDAISLSSVHSISWYTAAATKTWQLYGGTGANAALNLVTLGTGAFKIPKTISLGSGTGTGSGLQVQAATPSIALKATGSGTDNRLWDNFAVGAILTFRAVKDDESNATNWLAVTRSGISITDISMPLLNLSTGPLKVAGTQVVNTRRTGWTVATGTASRAAFATSSVTLQTLAGVVMALEQDLIAHGLIGA